LTRIKRNKAALVDQMRALKSGPCVDCGISFHFSAMDFDHRPGEIKKFNVSAAQGRNMERVLKEIAKCDLVCSNCHRFRTFSRL